MTIDINTIAKNAISATIRLLLKAGYTLILVLGGFRLAAAQVKAYPAPAGQTLSPDYTIEVNGRPVAVYPVITQHHDKKYALTYFDF